MIACNHGKVQNFDEKRVHSTHWSHKNNNSAKKLQTILLTKRTIGNFSECHLLHYSKTSLNFYFLIGEAFLIRQTLGRLTRRPYLVLKLSYTMSLTITAVKLKLLSSTQLAGKITVAFDFLAIPNVAAY